MNNHFTIIGLLILISLLTSGFKSYQPSPTGYTIEFPLWYLFAFLAVVIILIVALVVFLKRRGKRAKEKINPPKSRKKNSRSAGKSVRSKE